MRADRERAFFSPWREIENAAHRSAVHQAIAILKQTEALSGLLAFIFPGEYEQDKCMSDNIVNKALRMMGYDKQNEVCGNGFRAMACSALSESGLWS
ncbi:hypothetical protein [Citrobacter amalonaticus]|uniref:Uncharacterized protein n=1 Tax=Citrobacter amalonaticus TaxID=35703 RepID=A0A8I0T0M3_CITAM|nr:hypothetical protein [Citrobacter amalonaticus]HAT6805000.1 hypothetical protein [Citrobacter freundii]AMG90976.1 hypothetical protein AL479_00030 [Citrobacter amalonaticus]EKW2924744.1 hypothetical protein [Citrobacter amalonaticus]ELK6622612.1 hypothetical protein [Citrobacter amalonaticus]MBE0129375.1 hypothetical protein [Citrobacter amalonaticus]